jgi:hypothetical protein
LGRCSYASTSTSMWVSQTYSISNLYCIYKNSWQLIAIDSLFPFFKKCTESSRQNLLQLWVWAKLRGDTSFCFMD